MAKRQFQSRVSEDVQADKGALPVDGSELQQEPTPAAPEPPEYDTDIDDIIAWKPPFHLRYHLFSMAGLVATGLWVAGSLEFIDRQLGWHNMGELLPHEMGGLAAGTLTPLALLWMVIAFYERGQQLRRETEALRWYLRRMIYPSEHQI